MATKQQPKTKPPEPADSLKEKESVAAEEQAPTPPEPEPEEKIDLDDFFSPKKQKADFTAFVSQMKMPREKIEAPPLLFGEEEDEEAEPTADGDPLPDVEEGTLSHFDYEEDHERTAEFVLMIVDQAFCFCASMYSGEDMEKYARFSGKKRPTGYQISVTAAMVKKYQAKMSLEYMFASVLVMAFLPTANQAIKDRRARKAKEEAEARRREAELLAGRIQTQKNG